MARFRLVIVANRLYAEEAVGEGEQTNPRAAGGLVAVVSPAAGAGVAWVGGVGGNDDRDGATPGSESSDEWVPTARGPLCQRRIRFARETWQGFYQWSANAFLWPLLHLVRPFPRLREYFPVPLTPSAEAWAEYRSANRAYADTAVALESERAWVHDYQLGLVPAFLREAGFKGSVGFFLHTPFPEWEVANEFLDAAGRERFREWLEGVLAADLVGLQSSADARRLARAAHALTGAKEDPGGLRLGSRVVAVEPHPVGPDPTAVIELGRSIPDPPWLAQLRALGLPVVVGLERADYTKGVPERLRAVGRLLEKGRQFVHIGAEAPTRPDVPGYERLDRAIDDAVDAAREAAKRAGLPFEVRREALPWREVVALLRAADVLVAPSLADGMNLVPLQAAIAQAVRPEEARAVLVVGADTGVAACYGKQFVGAGLAIVDPLDDDALVRTIDDALDGHPGRISDEFIEAVLRHDARTWAEQYLARLEGLNAQH